MRLVGLACSLPSTPSEVVDTSTEARHLETLSYSGVHQVTSDRVNVVVSGDLESIVIHGTIGVSFVTLSILGPMHFMMAMIPQPQDDSAKLDMVSIETCNLN